MQQYLFVKGCTTNPRHSILYTSLHFHFDIKEVFAALWRAINIIMMNTEEDAWSNIIDSWYLGRQNRNSIIAIIRHKVSVQYNLAEILDMGNLDAQLSFLFSEFKIQLKIYTIFNSRLNEYLVWSNILRTRYQHSHGSKTFNRNTKDKH